MPRGLRNRWKLYAVFVCVRNTQVMMRWSLARGNLLISSIYLCCNVYVWRPILRVVGTFSSGGYVIHKLTPILLVWGFIHILGVSLPGCVRCAFFFFFTAQDGAIRGPVEF